MKFRVTVRKEGASDQEQIVEAASRFDVYAQVKNDGGIVISISKQHRFSLHELSHFNIVIGTGIKRSEIIRMAKNISTMLTAGLSLSRSLSVMERQSSNKHFKTLMADLSMSITKGASFHEALATHPKVFSELFIAMARAGEESGSMAESLSTVALQMERSEELVRKIRGAMIYPSIVMTAVVIVGVLMLIYVVPTLTSTFTQLGVKLPVTTQIIVDLSNFLITNLALVLATVVASTVGGISFVRSKRGGNMVAMAALHLPVVGELIRETYTARAARTLSSLLSSGVAVLEALSITKAVVGMPSFAQVVEEAEIRVRKGESLSASFAAHPKLYPILMSDMLAVGEETGKVANMLHQIAEFYESDVGEKTKDLSTIIEPVITLIIGAGVGVFAVSMISPIYQLSSAF
ncbi:MAG: type II secretion system F family protein [Minisyncoccia bacterium]